MSSTQHLPGATPRSAQCASRPSAARPTTFTPSNSSTSRRAPRGQLVVVGRQEPRIGVMGACPRSSANGKPDTDGGPLPGRASAEVPPINSTRSCSQQPELVLRCERGGVPPSGQSRAPSSADRQSLPPPLRNSTQTRGAWACRATLVTPPAPPVTTPSPVGCRRGPPCRSPAESSTRSGRILASNRNHPQGRLQNRGRLIMDGRRSTTCETCSMACVPRVRGPPQRAGTSTHPRPLGGPAGFSEWPSKNSPWPTLSCSSWPCGGRSFSCHGRSASAYRGLPFRSPALMQQVPASAWRRSVERPGRPPRGRTTRVWPSSRRLS